MAEVTSFDTVCGVLLAMTKARLNSDMLKKLGIALTAKELERESKTKMLEKVREHLAELAADVDLARRLLVRDVEAAVDEVLGVLVRKDRADLRASCVHRGRDDG